MTALTARLGLAGAALGALQTLAFVHTWAWALPLVTGAVLVGLLRGAPSGRAFALAWCYGTGWLVAGVWWLFISMHRYGHLPAPLSALAVLALAATLSLYLGAAAVAWARWRPGRPVADALLWAALWLLAELARGVIFTGFPWVAAGYAQVDGPLAKLAPWLGVYGMGAAAALMSAALAAACAARRWAPALAVAAVLALLALLPTPVFTRPAGELQVALLQANVPQDEKFAEQRLPQILAWVAKSLLEARAELVIGPETAVPLLPEQLEGLAPGYWKQLQEHFIAGGHAALVGRPLGDFERGYTNSVLALGAGAAGGYRYDKSHLVPFGEFIPRGFRWFTDLMNIPLGDFARGPVDAPSFAYRGQRVAPNICYEDLFGEELARRFVDEAQAPTLLANLSNIGWFGDTIAIDQHLHISRLRTLELQRPMVRATNTGATAAITHEGRVQAMLAPFTRGTLAATVQGREGLTPFAWWAGRLGLWPLALAGLLLAAGAVASARFRPPGRGHPSAPGGPAVPR